MVSPVWLIRGHNIKKAILVMMKKKKQGKPKLKVKINITPQTKTHILERISLQKI